MKDRGQRYSPTPIRRGSRRVRSVISPACFKGRSRRVRAAISLACFKGRSRRVRTAYSPSPFKGRSRRVRTAYSPSPFRGGGRGGAVPRDQRRRHRQRVHKMARLYARRGGDRRQVHPRIPVQQQILIRLEARHLRRIQRQPQPRRPRDQQIHHQQPQSPPENSRFTLVSIQPNARLARKERKLSF